MQHCRKMLLLHVENTKKVPIMDVGGGGGGGRGHTLLRPRSGALRRRIPDSEISRRAQLVSDLGKLASLFSLVTRLTLSLFCRIPHQLVESEGFRCFRGTYVLLSKSGLKSTSNSKYEIPEFFSIRTLYEYSSTRSTSRSGLQVE